MIALFSQPYARRFYAPLISTASIITLAAFVALLILPFVFAYASGSFWLKENTFRQQPSIRYTDQLLLLLEGTDTSSGTATPTALAWSTSVLYNQAVDANARVTTIQTAEVDEDFDGLNDYMTFTLSTPLKDTESITHVRLALVLNYQLQATLRLSMTSLLVIDASTAIPSSSLHVDGDVNLVQRVLVKGQTDNTLYDAPPINFTQIIGVDGNAARWKNILGEYNQRDGERGGD
ncbi:hypothetical protein HK104_010042 [Borealophlyctis nickersoniae]|nr:hypothetical protein HK104_010042 [Borealophlyctis nickersoniae]